MDLDKCNVSLATSKKCCRSDRGYTFINAQNGVKILEKKFFQFTKRMQCLTGKKNTQQATGRIFFAT
jgi:hypothetical protein